MASIRVKDFIHHLRLEITIALEDAVKENFPRVHFDSQNLLKSFSSSLQLLCEDWEEIPENMLRPENQDDSSPL